MAHSDAGLLFGVGDLHRRANEGAQRRNGVHDTLRGVERGEKSLSSGQVGPVEHVGHGVRIAVAQILDDHSVLAAEVLVNGANRHVGLLAQLVDPRLVDPLLAEQADRRSKDAFTRPSAAATTQPTFRRGCCGCIVQLVHVLDVTRRRRTVRSKENVAIVNVPHRSGVHPTAGRTLVPRVVAGGGLLSADSMDDLLGEAQTVSWLGDDVVRELPPDEGTVLTLAADAYGPRPTVATRASFGRLLDALPDLPDVVSRGHFAGLRVPRPQVRVCQSAMDDRSTPVV